jgi:hypothetical protein
VRLFVALAAAAPLFAQTCTYNVSPTQFSIGAGDLGGSITGTVINVTAQDGCGFHAFRLA